ncbi:MAG: Uncharacterised protein [Cellulomonadaceae bacterium TMED98]|nr:MAG: Uncharacterised protein [Cellulomonadaceae bacterium TMED98]
MELDIGAALQKTLLEVLVAGAVGDVPLAGRHNFQRLIAFFKKLHRVRNRLWLALEVA